MIEVYLWCCALRYRGYLICPVDTGTGSLFGVAILDPFGMEVGDGSTDQLVTSTEQVWQIGKQFADADLLRLAEDIPEAVNRVPQEGCHCV